MEDSQEPLEKNRRRHPRKFLREGFTRLSNQLPDSFFTVIEDITDRLTLTKIAIALLAGIFGVIVLLFYENRHTAFEYVVSSFREPPNKTDWSLSKESKVDLVKHAVKTSYIDFILVTRIDLPKNRRQPLFWHVKGDLAEDINNRAALIMPQPVFDSDGKNTSQMLAVLSSDFLCTPFEDTTFNRFFSEMASNTKVICRISIPPIYGQFNGILTVGLNKIPTIDEITIIKQDLTVIANTIYINDIIKKPSLLQQ